MNISFEVSDNLYSYLEDNEVEKGAQTKSEALERVTNWLKKVVENKANEVYRVQQIRALEQEFIDLQ